MPPFQDDKPDTEEELKTLEGQLKAYDTTVLKRLNSQLKLGTISEPEYQQLMEEHQRNMQICNDKLERYGEQLWEFMGLSDEETKSTSSSDEVINHHYFVCLFA